MTAKNITLAVLIVIFLVLVIVDGRRKVKHNKEKANDIKDDIKNDISSDISSKIKSDKLR
jgi:hypothetical protein